LKQHRLPRRRRKSWRSRLWHNRRRPRSRERQAEVDAQRDSDGLRLTFSFPAATPAALFRRADTVWMVFDTPDPIDVDSIRAKGGALIADVSRIALEKGQAVRFRLNRPQMPSLESDDRSRGVSWTLTLRPCTEAAAAALRAAHISEPALANVSVPLANPVSFTGWSIRCRRRASGSSPRARPAASSGGRNFVELSSWNRSTASCSPDADDVKAEVGADKVMLGRPGGLTLSSADVAASARTPR